MQAPATYNFLDHYENDGLRKFTMQFKYSATDNPVNLIGSKIRMQLVNTSGQVAWEFSTLPGKDGRLTIGNEGVLTFETINSWGLKPGVYSYDLEITFPDGFVKTYMTGTWKVNRDITK